MVGLGRIALYQMFIPQGLCANLLIIVFLNTEKQIIIVVCNKLLFRIGLPDKINCQNQEICLTLVLLVYSLYCCVSMPMFICVFKPVHISESLLFKLRSKVS